MTKIKDVGEPLGILRLNSHIEKGDARPIDLTATLVEYSRKRPLVGIHLPQVRNAILKVEDKISPDDLGKLTAAAMVVRRTIIDDSTHDADALLFALGNIAERKGLQPVNVQYTHKKNN